MVSFTVVIASILVISPALGAPDPIELPATILHVIFPPELKYLPTDLSPPLLEGTASTPTAATVSARSVGTTTEEGLKNGLQFITQEFFGRSGPDHKERRSLASDALKIAKKYGPKAVEALGPLATDLAGHIFDSGYSTSDASAQPTTPPQRRSVASTMIKVAEKYGPDVAKVLEPVASHLAEKAFGSGSSTSDASAQPTAAPAHRRSVASTIGKVAEKYGPEVAKALEPLASKLAEHVLGSGSSTSDAGSTTARPQRRSLGDKGLEGSAIAPGIEPSIASGTGGIPCANPDTAALKARSAASILGDLVEKFGPEVVDGIQSLLSGGSSDGSVLPAGASTPLLGPLLKRNARTCMDIDLKQGAEDLLPLLGGILGGEE
ncbi:hypothetical protein GLOTRDRAFT_94863 [Gloeophyllum trabeum ATCC 11539]|uniref:Uncharacterized protein n=1 Tax=Gloeophyllum trabeum (strain ATCC 11539 / FP-39264 / Madison 617) TaxID=670483 RepID=S7RHC6_GLOTA|nr:uncharacterized protein GLOTRDRAFT_94863 [Gloeophyllum trabeum ATCC 11539]EPQ53685.1 hypothetical protein GLOTRDRAFT_94863 [Gloeophyllum trabeum ATCC 11539]